MTGTTTDSNQRTKTQEGEPTFSALDEERQASMADEGGVSGALMEVEGEESTSPRIGSRRPHWVMIAMGLALLGVAVALFARTYPQR